MLNTYSNASNARRAAKAAGHTAYTIVPVDGRFAVQLAPVANTTGDQLGGAMVADMAPVAKASPVEVALPPKFKPVAFVHAWLSANTGLKRKAAIEALVAQGINFWTARTQYQVWRTAK